MPTFPVTSSILSSAHLGQFLQKKYGLRDNTSCQLLKAGVNHSYLVTDGTQKAIFRIYSLNWRTETEVREELRLLTLLQENGLPVSYPLADVAGTFIQELDAPEGKRFGVLFSFAEGEKLLTFSEELHSTIGQIMARFHQLTHNLKLNRVSYTPQLMLVDSLAFVKPFLPADSAEMNFLYTTQRYLLDEFSKIDRTKTREGIVHLDIWFDNLNINKENQVTLFDFDFCGSGLQCIDIAYYILQIHSTETDEAEFRKKKESFLAGYESVTKISEEEQNLLPMLGLSVYFFYLGVQCQRFDNWSNVFLNELHLKRLINLRVKRWADFNKITVN
ncbi:phosphotransferase [Spirosoma radiotolerans]|uniref:Aminoglycoside phosphotransferase n=1 Tax=Spirosoma radiotolerans TaxID=1379870 RepID=A0A0E4A0I7_9BACT|nr:phosphotransferase [Spirosoma radiotolerans]AKD58650.1 aminoglycoside phosphotransferase [Spirosoma radiotolerans]